MGRVEWVIDVSVLQPQRSFLYWRTATFENAMWKENPHISWLVTGLLMRWQDSGQVWQSDWFSNDISLYLSENSDVVQFGSYFHYSHHFYGSNETSITITHCTGKPCGMDGLGSHDGARSFESKIARSARKEKRFFCGCARPAALPRLAHRFYTAITSCT